MQIYIKNYFKAEFCKTFTFKSLYLKFDINDPLVLFNVPIYIEEDVCHQTGVNLLSPCYPKDSHFQITNTYLNNDIPLFNK